MTLDQSIPQNLDLLLQTMLSQLPLARLAQQTLSEITQFGFEAHLGSLAIEASRLVAETKRSQGHDDTIKSAAAQLCERAQRFITATSANQENHKLQGSALVLQAFVFYLKAIATTCILHSAASPEIA